MSSGVPAVLCRPSDGMVCWPVDPSLPVVRPSCLHTLLMSHTAQHRARSIPRISILSHRRSPAASPAARPKAGGSQV